MMSKEFEFMIASKKVEWEGDMHYEFTLPDDRNEDRIEILVLPAFESNRLKELIECTSNTLCKLTTGLTNNCKYGSSTTDLGFEVEMNSMLKELGNLMQCLVNSTSYKEGKIYTFDYIEFKNRLDRVNTFLERAVARES